MTIDLTEPAEVRLQHEAIEHDPFTRKVIDKSKSLHFEFEGPEAHRLTENLEAFVDDVITGKIDRKKLREVLQEIEMLKEEFGREVQHIEERLDTSVGDISLQFKI